MGRRREVGVALGLLLVVLGIEPLAYLVAPEAAVLVHRQGLRVDGRPARGGRRGGAGWRWSAWRGCGAVRGAVRGARRGVVRGRRAG